MIKVTVDDKEVLRMLKGLSGRVKNMKPVMKEIAGIMHDAVEENFEQQGRPRWEPSKRAMRQRGKTLQDTGSLAASISQKSDNVSAQVGTNKVYAAIHHFGGKAGRGKKVSIPARPFLKLTGSDMWEIKNKIIEYLKP